MSYLRTFFQEVVGTADSAKQSVGASVAGAVDALKQAIQPTLELNPGNPTVFGGQRLAFTATLRHVSGASENVTATVVWTSSDPKIVSIDKGGKAVAHRAAGTATISARDKKNNVTASSVVTVIGIQSIQITPDKDEYKGLGTLQFQATGVLSDGSTQDLGGQVTWTSSAPNVISIQNDEPAGTASFLDDGVTTITAKEKVSGVTGSLKVKIKLPGKTARKAEVQVLIKDFKGNSLKDGVRVGLEFTSPSGDTVADIKEVKDGVVKFATFLLPAGSLRFGLVDAPGFVPVITNYVLPESDFLTFLAKERSITEEIDAPSQGAAVLTLGYDIIEHGDLFVVTRIGGSVTDEEHSRFRVVHGSSEYDIEQVK